MIAGGVDGGVDSSTIGFFIINLIFSNSYLEAIRTEFTGIVVGCGRQNLDFFAQEAIDRSGCDRIPLPFPDLEIPILIGMEEFLRE